MLSVVLFSCKENDHPDVSRINIKLETLHFEDDFFSIDTTDIDGSLQSLQRKYPGFLEAYMQNIMGLPYHKDSLLLPDVSRAIVQFLNDYRLVKDSVGMKEKEFAAQEDQIKEAFRYIAYYFPNYPLPTKLVTFIGPFDAFFSTSFGVQGDILMKNYVGIGLQLHLGSDFSFFTSEVGQRIYPRYVSAHFTPDYIPINCMFNIVDDLSENTAYTSLIENMVEMGKKYYLMTRFLPDRSLGDLLGYTPDQLKDTRKNEAVIWDFFLHNDVLNATDPEIVRNYVGPGPSTQAFGPKSPGNIGSFTGLRIVEKYMEKYPKTSLKELMKLPPRSIYEKSKYKPR